MRTFVSMNFIFILWGDNGITYKHFNLIFGIIILNHYFDKKSTPNVLNRGISTLVKKISAKILSALMKTISEFERVIYKRKALQKSVDFKAWLPQIKN